MAITFVKQRKKQKNLVFILIGLLLATILIVWFGFFRRETGTPLMEKVSYPVAEEIKINFEVLRSPFLKSLQQFYEIRPLKETASQKPEPGEEEIPQKPGRENPFLSY